MGGGGDRRDAAADGTLNASSCLYERFLDAHARRSPEREPLEPSEHSRHALSLTARTPNGGRVALSTQLTAPFFRGGAAPARGVAAALAFESQPSPLLGAALRVSSERHVELRAQLRASSALRFTLEAREAATDRAPASFARIGCDYHDAQSGAFAGAVLDAVNGPTLQATLGARLGDVRFGVIGAYDVGLDHSDRRGRFSRLDAAASYARDDLVALLQINNRAKLVRLDLTQEVTPELLAGSAFVYDRRKDKKTMRARAQYELNARESLGGSLGSDGLLVGAYEWRTSAHLKTRVTAQMDVRHFDSDSHHLGVSIEIN